MGEAQAEADAEPEAEGAWSVAALVESVVSEAGREGEDAGGRARMATRPLPGCLIPPASRLSPVCLPPDSRLPPTCFTPASRLRPACLSRLHPA